MSPCGASVGPLAAGTTHKLYGGISAVEKAQSAFVTGKWSLTTHPSRGGNGTGSHAPP